jgi:hypothetical protein
MVVSDGVQCLAVLVSYGLVYINLAQASEDEETSSQRRAVMILTLSYIIFILPHSIFESLPEETANRALLSVVIHAWFWCVYVDNFFIYIFFWRRVRKAIQLLMADLVDMTGLGCHKSQSENKEETDIWWTEMNKLGSLK